ncbi:MAG: hypothetical protein R2939_02330 [Kofleriaceae bacterium]
MQVAELDQVTCDVEVDGELVRRTLDRLALERGGWATVLLLYQDRERTPSGEPGPHWRPARAMLVRLQRRGGGWRRHASATLATAEAARVLGERLLAWFSPGALASRGEASTAFDDDEDDDG